MQVSGVSKAADENKIQSGLSFTIPTAASGDSFERISATELESDSPNSVEFNLCETCFWSRFTSEFQCDLAKPMPTSCIAQINSDGLRGGKDMF